MKARAVAIHYTPSEEMWARIAPQLKCGAKQKTPPTFELNLIDIF